MCAVLVAVACTVGLIPTGPLRLAALSRGRLSCVAQKYVRAGTLATGARLVNYDATLPFAQAGGGGEGRLRRRRALRCAVRTINAGPNPRYFGVGRGVTYFNSVGRTESCTESGASP